MEKIFCSLFLYFVTCTTLARQLTKCDYARAVSFIWQNLNNKKVFNANVDANWFTDSAGFSFITQNKQGKTFNKLEFQNMRIEPLFDQQRLAKILADSLKIPVKSTDLPVSTIRYIDKTKISFIAGGKTYLLDLNTYQLSRKVESLPDPLETKSPDGRWIAYTDQYNLYIKSAGNGTIKQLSTGGKKNYEYATYYGWSDIIEGENGGRPPRFRVNWSPDSKWIQTYICDLQFGNKMELFC